MAITSSGVQEVPPAFRARLEHANMLLGLLRSIRVLERPKCIFTMTNEGLRATCENSRVMQGSAILPKSIFQSFDLRVPEISVKVNLNVLLTCFATSASELDPLYTSFHTSAGDADSDMLMDLIVRDEDSPLELAVTEGNVTTELELGSEIGGFSVFPEIRPENRTSRVTIPSPIFAEMYTEFDSHSEDMGFRVDPAVFRIFFESVGGKSELVVDNSRPESRVKYEFLNRQTDDPDEHHTYLFRLDQFRTTVESLLRSKTMIITTTYAQTSIRYQCLVDEDTAAAGIHAEIEYVMIAKANVDGDPYPRVMTPPPGFESLHLTDESDLPAGADFTTVNQSYLNQLTQDIGPVNNRSSEQVTLTAEQPPAAAAAPGATFVNHATQSVHHYDHPGEGDDTFDYDFSF